MRPRAERGGSNLCFRLLRQSLRSFLAMPILALLCLYRGFVWIAFQLYSKGVLKRTKVAAKVISVGNITFGGSGKTPLVEFLAKALSAKGESVAVLMRGYGNDERETARRNLDSIPLRGGYRTPLLIGQDRVKNAERAIKEHGAKTLILDDGFQHLRLKRDLDIVTIDATDYSANGPMVPSGILREPLSGLKRADIFVITRCDESEKLEIISEKLRKINKDAPIFESYYKPLGLQEYPTGQMIDSRALGRERVALLSAIGNPGYFKKVAEAASLNIAREFIFPDHYDYVASDIQGISDECAKKGITHVVTTQKDIVKLEKIIDEENFPKPLKFYTLLTEVVIKNEEGFLRKVQYALLRS